MIVFDTQKITELESLLESSVLHFRESSGNAYGIICDVAKGSCEQLSSLYSRIGGLPDSPGPFKQLAAFAVLTQEVRLFNFATRDSTEDLDVVWNPRLTLWCLSAVATTLRLNGNHHAIVVPVLPTPHFQAEFINHLRSFYNGRILCGVETSTDLLSERILATALILEASSYAKDCSDEEFTRNAEDCLEKIAENPVLRGDIQFNDPEFLNLAIGIGLED